MMMLTTLLPKAQVTQPEDGAQHAVQCDTQLGLPAV